MHVASWRFAADVAMVAAGGGFSAYRLIINLISDISPANGL